MDLKERSAIALESVRGRSLELLAPLGDDDLLRQHSRLMSPLVWDLAHIGNYEDLWLVRAAGRGSGVDPSLDGLYDAFRHPRADRPSLPLLPPADARRYIADVRGRALEALDRIEFDPKVPLLAEGFVVGLVVQHEHQHDETMLATLQLMEGDGYRPIAPPPPAPGDRPAGRPAEVLVPGGPFVMGSNEPWAYDNERPAHVVDLADYWIDVFPVTNRQYQEFIDAGGYQRSDWWSRRGWCWRREAGLQSPQFWQRAGRGSWVRNRFGLVEDVAPDEPVQHVCWYEADAYARWAGKRLPTEAEWEKAARWAPRPGPGAPRPDDTARSRRGAADTSGPPSGPNDPAVSGRYPWGDAEPAERFANLSGRHYRPAPVGAYPDGAAPCGAQQLIGDVWEWTSSDFEGYPGFTSFPYREYSEVFFGPEYKVLRGGSWATSPGAIRSTFRNWDLPIRRQIFSGLRCARDG